MKIVINTCFGGFSLSKAAFEFAKAKGYSWADGERCYNNDFYPDVERNNPELVYLVEELGTDIAGSCLGTKLCIITVPDDANWYIDNYDGVETVKEPHRVWG